MIDPNIQLSVLASAMSPCQNNAIFKLKNKKKEKNNKKKKKRIITKKYTIPDIGCNSTVLINSVAAATKQSSNSSIKCAAIVANAADFAATTHT